MEMAKPLFHSSPPHVSPLPETGNHMCYFVSLSWIGGDQKFELKRALCEKRPTVAWKPRKCSGFDRWIEPEENTQRWRKSEVSKPSAVWFLTWHFCIWSTKEAQLLTHESHLTFLSFHHLFDIFWKTNSLFFLHVVCFWVISSHYAISKYK